MPHLSPMMWPLASMFLFSLIIMTMSQAWWQPQPSFPTALASMSSTPMKSWPWI